MRWCEKFCDMLGPEAEYPGLVAMTSAQNADGWVYSAAFPSPRRQHKTLDCRRKGVGGVCILQRLGRSSHGIRGLVVEYIVAIDDPGSI